MNHVVRVSLLVVTLVLGAAGLAGASVLVSAGRLVYPWVVSDATRETLIVVTRVDTPNQNIEDPLPIHLNFFDDACLVRDRQDELTRFDADIYVYGGFATGIPEAHLEIHEASGTAHGDEVCEAETGGGTVGCLQEGTGPLIGEAIVIDFANDAMAGYSAVSAADDDLSEDIGGGRDQVLGVPGFLAEVPGVLTNRLILAAVPCFPSSGVANCTFTDVDTYPSGSSDLFTVDGLLFDGNEEANSAHFQFKCGLNKSLFDLFGPIAQAGFLPPDAKSGPRILFFPYGWVRLGVEFAPTGLTADNWWVTGILYQRYTDGVFSWGEATNIFDRLPRDPSLDPE